jgi:hypothetical protein
MAILRFPISSSEPCSFAIFKPINFKFWILIENYITTNDTSDKFFDKLSISSGIELELEPSRFKGDFKNQTCQLLNFKLIGLKMAKIQGSDGLMGKRKIAILNIDSILNNFFWAK